MIRFVEYSVLAPSIARRRRASAPTWTAPLGRNATTDGSVARPSSSTGHARPPSAATVLVVPRSIPMRIIPAPRSLAAQVARQALARLAVHLGRIEVVDQVRLVMGTAHHVVQLHVATRILPLAREHH